jgi:hypothetical protein
MLTRYRPPEAFQQSSIILDRTLFCALTPTILHECSAATRAGPGGAAKAVVAGQNLAILDRRRIEFPKMKGPGPFFQVHLQHLIEVAVEDFAGPTDADGVATH